MVDYRCHAATLGQKISQVGRTAGSLSSRVSSVRSDKVRIPHHCQSQNSTDHWRNARSAIQAALAATTTEPASPGSLASTAVTNDEEDDPTPPVAQQLVEFELMRLLFDTMSGSLDHQASPSSAAQLPPLTITYRDALSSATKEPMVSMSALKSWLLKFAKERQCSEDLATKAIYSLVSKNVLRIDRRGTAAVGFRS